MKLRDSHIFDRHPEGHYVEPLDLDRALIKALAPALPKGATILDPCCGFGRIVRAASEHGFSAFGYDIAPRWEDNPDGKFDTTKTCFVEVDYLKRATSADAIVMNPPYGQTIAFVDKALREARVLVAAIVPATWINGLATARWLAQTPWAFYWSISPRPSMPPGEYILAGKKPGGGTKDFSVLVWLTSVKVQPTVCEHLFWRDQ